MTDLRKAAETLLKAIEEDEPLRYATRWDDFLKDEVQALRQALAQPEQEPECVAVIGNWGKVEWRDCVFPQLGDRLYTAPPKKEWVGLTDDQIYQILGNVREQIDGNVFLAFAKDIEAKLKDKNT